MMRACLILSRGTYTPIDFWLELPLSELGAWIKSYIDLTDEIENSREKR
ncbi:MAG: hypothetical protein IKJ91_00145 [Clostridia bacterium]|nr:hypothetical protein [Clostridia bacterium]